MKWCLPLVCVLLGAVSAQEATAPALDPDLRAAWQQRLIDADARVTANLEVLQKLPQYAAYVEAVQARATARAAVTKQANGKGWTVNAAGLLVPAPQQVTTK